VGSDKYAFPVRLACGAAIVALTGGCTGGTGGARHSAAATSLLPSGSAAAAPSAWAAAPTETGVPAAPSTTRSPAPDPAEALRRLAAAAAGRSWSAHYRLVETGQPAVAVTVDWTPSAYRIALTGTGSTSVFVANRHGTWTCEVTKTAQCVLAAGPGKPVPAALDPELEKVFRSYLGELAAHADDYTLSVDGGCFGVRRKGAATASTVGKGTYCWNSDGLLTKYDAPSGTLTLTSSGPAPDAASITTPAPA
jgi:hypothetical protein